MELTSSLYKMICVYSCTRSCSYGCSYDTAVLNLVDTSMAFEHMASWVSRLCVGSFYNTFLYTHQLCKSLAASLKISTLQIASTFAHP